MQGREYTRKKSDYHRLWQEPEECSWDWIWGTLDEGGWNVRLDKQELMDLGALSGDTDLIPWMRGDRADSAGGGS